MTVTFLVTPRFVWLARKKRKIGKGYFNGYGGKVEAGETPLQSAVREVKQESTVTVFQNRLVERAVIEFWRRGVHEFTCHMYVTTLWEGNPQETPEMEMPEPFRRGSPPLSKMMVGDRLWVRQVILGQEIPRSPDGSRFIHYDYHRKKVIEHNIPEYAI